jgi:hypothetical protein
MTTSYRHHTITFRRAVVFLTVCFVHAVGISLLANSRSRPIQLGSGAESSNFLEVAITASHQPPEIAPLQFEFEPPELLFAEASTLTVSVQPASSAPEAVLEEGARFTPPQIDPSQVIDARPFAREAGLLPHEVVDVVLSIDVGVDGTIKAVVVVRGAGRRQIDAAAVSYARALTWTPGSVGGEARRMRTQLTVRLEG